MYDDDLEPDLTPELVLSMFRTRNPHGCASLARKLESILGTVTKQEVWPHVQTLLHRGELVRYRWGQFKKPPPPVLRPRATPKELQFLRHFVYEEPMGFFAIQALAGNMTVSEVPRRISTPGKPGQYLTRLCKRGLLARIGKARYALTRAGRDHMMQVLLNERNTDASQVQS